MCVSGSVVSDSLQPHGHQPTRLLCPWDFPGKNTGVGTHSFLQRIFLTQKSNPHLLHCRQILSCLSLQGACLFLVVWIKVYVFATFNSIWLRKWKFLLFSESGSRGTTSKHHLLSVCLMIKCPVEVGSRMVTLLIQMRSITDNKFLDIILKMEDNNFRFFT